MQVSNPILFYDIRVRLYDIYLENEPIEHTSIKNRIINNFIQFNTSSDALSLRLNGISYFFELTYIDENSFFISFTKFKNKHDISFSNERKWIDTKKFKLKFDYEKNTIYASLNHFAISGLKSVINIKYRHFTIDIDTDFNEIWYNLLDKLDILQLSSS